jgi:uncharacterized membrane protein YphA (DoxX/SURF4 family)
MSSLDHRRMNLGLALEWPILMADGFWKMAHEARTDYSMLLGSIFLLVVGSGTWSLDAWLWPTKTIK